MTGINPALFLRALSFSADKHRHAKRKDVDETPYILHPIAVATVLAVEGDVTDETLLIAALLHDTVEDVEEVTYEMLVENFGVEVADIVLEVTNDEAWSKKEKKMRQAERMNTASVRAKQLKIADKICNIRDIMQIPPVGWSVERRLEYLAGSKLVVDNCRGINPALEAAFDAALQEGEKTLTELQCCCMKPPFNFSSVNSQDIGTDKTDGRYGDVTLSTCKACGNKWLRYFVEYESFSRSGRWYMGVISEETANTVTPETAVFVLQSLEWRIAGGSYFDSAGFKHTGHVDVGI